MICSQLGPQKDFLIKISKKEKQRERERQREKETLRGRGEERREDNAARHRVSPYSGKCNSIFTFLAAFLRVGAGTGYSLAFPHSISITNFSMKDGLWLLHWLLEMDSCHHKRPDRGLSGDHPPLVTCPH